MWDVQGEDFPGLAPSYARLETVLGLLEARARDWERFYLVTVVESEAPDREHTFDGSKMKKAPPVNWREAA